jgi:hypothetical protein
VTLQCQAAVGVNTLRERVRCSNKGGWEVKDDRRTMWVCGTHARIFKERGWVHSARQLGWDERSRPHVHRWKVGPTQGKIAVALCSCGQRRRFYTKLSVTPYEGWASKQTSKTPPTELRYGATP